VYREVGRHNTGSDAQRNHATSATTRRDAERGAIRTDQHGRKKESKQKPAKTLAEKRAAKREKQANRR